MLELEGLVEHLLYATYAHGVAVDVNAGVVAEACITAVAAPSGSHGGVVDSGESRQEIE